MLKLAVSDIDGTLINKSGTLSPKFDFMLDMLNSKSILFSAASGRSYDDIVNIFGNDLVKNILIIACDGGLAVYKGKALFINEIADDIIKRCFDNFGILYERIKTPCGKTVKIVVREQENIDISRKYTENNKLLSLVYNNGGSMEYTGYGVNKGSALLKILEKLKVSKDEVIAFGDNYNDKEMLKLIPKSYAMASAPLEIKRICRFTSEDVCNTIIKIMEDGGEYYGKI